MAHRKKYRAALVGLGRIAVTLEDDPLRAKPCSHAGAWRSSPSVEIVAGCDVDPGKRRYFSERCRVDRTYADHREMLKNEKIDILSVATWTDSHAEIVTDAARRGNVRAILCEKPIALNTADASSMIRACRRAGILLVVNHERRFEDRYRLAKKLVDSGRLGEIRTIVGNVLTSVPMRQKSFTVDGTSLLHDGTHLVDIVNYLAGPPAWVEGFVHRSHREAMTAVMRLKGGASVFIETGGLREYFNFELDIQGTEGRILIGNTHFSLYRKRKSLHYSKFTELGRVRLPRFRRNNYFRQEVGEIVRWLDGGRRAVDSTGEDGLAALEVIEAVFRSSRADGKRIFLPRR